MGLSSPHTHGKYSSVGVSKIKSNTYFLEQSESITLNENRKSMPRLNLNVLPQSRILGSRMNPDLPPSTTRPYSSSSQAGRINCLANRQLVHHVTKEPFDSGRVKVNSLFKGSRQGSPMFRSESGNSQQLNNSPRQFQPQNYNKELDP